MSFLEDQITIIEQNRLLISEASYPQLKERDRKQAVYIKSFDVDVLCKLAKANDIEVVLYCEKKRNRYDYYIAQEYLSNIMSVEDEVILEEIEAYNNKGLEIDLEVPYGVTFYFLLQDRYFIQEFLYDGQEVDIPTAREKIEELQQKYYNDEIYNKSNYVENEKQRIETRNAMLKEFRDALRTYEDLFEYDMGRKEYARKIFLASKQFESFRTLFYEEDDLECENIQGQEKCAVEIERVFQMVQQERILFQKREEYNCYLQRLEDVVRCDSRFWSDTSGWNDYIKDLFKRNKKAQEFRTLFFHKEDINCVGKRGRESCYYVLRRIREKGTIPVKKKRNWFWKW